MKNYCGSEQNISANLNLFDLYRNSSWESVTKVTVENKRSDYEEASLLTCHQVSLARSFVMSSILQKGRILAMDLVGVKVMA